MRAKGGTCQTQSLICDMSVVLKPVWVGEGLCGFVLSSHMLPINLPTLISTALRLMVTVRSGDATVQSVARVG